MQDNLLFVRVSTQPNVEHVQPRSQSNLKHTYRLFSHSLHGLFQPHFAKHMTRLAPRAMNTVVEHLQVRSMERLAPVTCVANLHVSKVRHLPQKPSIAPNPNNAKSNLTGSSESMARSAAVNSSTAFQSFDLRFNSPSFRPTLEVCTSSGM